MGQAKRRGTRQERIKQAIEAGRLKKGKASTAYRVEAQTVTGGGDVIGFSRNGRDDRNQNA